ncbi:HlyD family secretion protein [Robertkochia sediminum]|uniref:HlyD family secretion protein n=1 Tax=Robertkochia sediminum TaxID=2785326 RepID=UPI001931B4FC|nr:HlyD family efflux transporter periplasmic adaptor subunit [Robertkochia sediminum]MBL7471695.1 HlyD family efflux transporter periplasmic adaptor subunit [Robertkochia sediminum]
MLNISTNRVNKKVDITTTRSGKKVFFREHHKTFSRLLGIFLLIMLAVMFLPWTQNVRGEGYVTTLTPGQRPQTVHAIIPGRVEKWYVREGQHVKKGDTIAFLSEIKDSYFDPTLLQRTEARLNAKKQSVASYGGKIKALDIQIDNLRNELDLKTQQLRNKLIQANLKVVSDSIDLEAAKTNLTIAERQYNRANILNQEGLKALQEVEDKKMKLQEAQAKKISLENKLLSSKNEVLNTEIEQGRILAEYGEKISKAESDKFSAMSMQFEGEGEVNKLANQYTNYEVRRSFNYVTAPQSGFINKALTSGLGETVKEGDPLVSIMPSDIEIAVETFISPIDLPLIHKGEKVRIQFDGWPVIIFSGWPNLSFGTFGGTVVAIENYISTNGKYRILIAPDPEDHPWPEEIRAGSGAQTIALLEDVPIWFELWRQLNGFPPNYYQPQQQDGDKAMKKK